MKARNAGSSWLFDDSHAKRHKSKRDAETLRNVLAESVASDIRVLRLALAEIVVAQQGYRTYGSCACSGERSCGGHITDVTKIARAALGLSALPDKPRIPIKPEGEKSD